jgi:hypothetical protein
MKHAGFVVCVLLAVLSIPSHALSQASDAVWTDPQTGLTWTTQDRESLHWDDAKSYCQNLRLAGRSDWRLPTIDELRGIDDPSFTGHVKYGDVHVNSNIHVTDQFEWSGSFGPPERHDGRTPPFIFAFNYNEAMPGDSTGWNNALCVSGRPAQPPQGPTFGQTVTWLRAKLSAEVVWSRVDVNSYGDLVQHFDDGSYIDDMRWFKTISIEQCHVRKGESTTDFPGIHLTGSWSRKGETTNKYIEEVTSDYICLEQGADPGPIVKALKHLAALDGQNVIDDDLFKP